MRKGTLLAMMVVGVIGAAVVGCKGTGSAGDATVVDVRGDGRRQEEVSVPDQGPDDGGGADLAIPDAMVHDGSGPGSSWVVFGGSIEAPAGGVDISVDAAGNSYVAGVYSGGAITLGTTALPSRSKGTPLIAKLGPSGKVLWVKVLTKGASEVSVRDISVDGAGKIFVTGLFWGSPTLGSTTLTSLGKSDGFVARLDSSGKVLWVESFGGTEADGPSAFAVDSSGGSYITGPLKYGSAAVFGSISLTSKGSNDIFVARLDPAGKFLWAVSGGGTKLDAAAGIALDSSGGLRIAATIIGAANFGSIQVVPKTAYATIVAKLDSSGKFLWASQGDGNDLWTTGIGVDAAGNSYVNGRFRQDAVFGSTVLSQGPTTKTRQFVVKLSPVGAIVWAVAGGEGYSYDIAVDSKGNSVITGASWGNPTFGTTKLTGYGGEDIFAARLDAQGKWTGAVLAGGAMQDHGSGVAMDGAGNAYVTGQVLSPLSARIPTVNTDTLTFGKQKTIIKGMDHMFVWKVLASSL